MNRLRSILLVSLITALAGCSTVPYRGTGHYTDSDQKSRQILLQWEAQKYYIPFMDADVDYGSVSLQAECKPDVLLDHRNHEEHGMVFVERPQQYKLAPGAPDIRIDNFLVCAKLKGSQSLEQAGQSGSVDLLVLCESKDGLATLPPTLDGYPLKISEGQAESTLLCAEHN